MARQWGAHVVGVFMNSFARMAVVCGLALCGVSTAADKFWSSPDAYLGEAPPGDAPKIFAPGKLVAPGTFTMGRVAFSSDGQEFYYTQSDSWETDVHAKLLVRRYAGGKWSEPSIVGAGFMSPTFSMDDKTLFMRHGGMKNVWRAQRTAAGWSTPEGFLTPAIGVYDFMPTRSGNIYVGSDPDTDDLKAGATYAFSLLTISGTDVTAKSLGRPLNGVGFNGDLFVAPDESYMIVSANETPTYESELHVSYRQPDHSWSKPVSLGPKINKGLAHRWGQYVTPDGKYLFYSHGTSEQDCAVYWVRFRAAKP
jgi:hypothetical protein